MARGLRKRGVKDILITCVDGLTGFPEAINAVFPDTKVQLYIVHMVRNSMKYVPYKDYKAVARDLKRIYQSATEDEALQALEDFANTYDGKYPQISKSWYLLEHSLRRGKAVLCYSPPHGITSIPCLLALKTSEKPFIYHECH